MGGRLEAGAAWDDESRAGASGHPEVSLEEYPPTCPPHAPDPVHLPGASPAVSLGSLGARNWVSSRLESVGH